MAQISYTNKIALNENPEIADINKVTDDDMNEIKQVVNDNYNNTIVISDTQPTSEDNKIWIDTGEVQNLGSEVHIGDTINSKIGLNILMSKNLLNKDIFSNAYLNNGVITNSPQSALFNYIGVIPNTTYTFSSSSSIRYLAIYEFNDTKNYLTTKLGENVSNYSFTTGNNTKYIRIDINKDASVVMTQSVINELTPQLEKGATATTYQPYITPTINVDGEDIYIKGQNEVYSTQEQRIGTWIDGKPIYRKVIDLGSLPNNTTKDVATGLINNNIRLTKIYGIAFTNDGNYQSSLGDMNSRFNLRPTNLIRITTTLDMSSYTGYAVLEYTKTTD